MEPGNLLDTLNVVERLLQVIYQHFLDENTGEYFFYKENGKWIESLK